MEDDIIEIRTFHYKEDDIHCHDEYPFSLSLSIFMTISVIIIFYGYFIPDII